MGWRGFGFFHHSRTVFCRAVPNANLTIRNFFVAVPQAAAEGAPRPKARRRKESDLQLDDEEIMMRRWRAEAAAAAQEEVGERGIERMQ